MMVRCFVACSNYRACKDETATDLVSSPDPIYAAADGLHHCYANGSALPP